MELIVAVDENWGIGRNGTQPITLAADRMFFRDITIGSIVIAGRKTIDDFPGRKPLPGRVNIVLSRTRSEIPGFIVCSDTDEVIELLSFIFQRTFVIGGGSVYRQMLPYCDTAYVTKIHATTTCDTLFPNLDEMEDWYLAEMIQRGNENGIEFEILLYNRR